MGRPSPSSRSTGGGRVGVAIMLLALLLCAVGAAAHSPHPPPVKRLHHPQRSRLRILPRRTPGLNGHLKRSRVVPPPDTLRYDDTLMLTASLPSLLPYDVHLVVSPTENLFGPNAKIVYQDNSGVTTRTEPLLVEDWRMYEGNVIRPLWAERVWEQERAGMSRNADAILGRASIMVHKVEDGTALWEGTFDIGGKVYNVLTRETYNSVKTHRDVEVAEIDGHMVVFTHEDMDHEKRSTSAATCGSDRLAYNNHPLNPARMRRDLPPHLLPRADDMSGSTPDTNYINSIGSSEGCPTDQRIVYMGVMLDCTYVAKFGSAAAARTNLLTKWNTVNSLYKNTFRISLGIVELDVRESACPATPSNSSNEDWNANCNSNLSLDDRLAAFSRWRGDRSGDNIGLWHLMTTCQSDTEVGVAWLGALCTTDTRHQNDGSWVSGTGVSSATTTEWNVIAHEIGHGFGAIHDCEQGCTLTSNCCPMSNTSCDAGGRYIMNPTTAPGEQQFSPCTLGNVCSFISNNNKACIVPVDSSREIISLNRCGNGIVESGEECDPGLNGNSTCCSSDCKLLPGANCDPSQGVCCSDTCQFVEQGTVCRPAIDVRCDTAEVCSGSAASCPEDVTTKDGTKCDNSNGLTCASGHCTSLNQQCQNAGQSQGLTQACGQKNDRSCLVACKDPTNANMCQILQTVLIDGSECGYGGRCYNGTCNSGSWQEQLNAMYTQNLQIAIPVTIAVAIIILAILWQLIRCCCNCARRQKRSNAPRDATTINARGDRPPPPVHTSSHGGLRYQALNSAGPTADFGAAPKPNPSQRTSDSSDGLHDSSASHGGPRAMSQLYPDPYATQNALPYEYNHHRDLSQHDQTYDLGYANTGGYDRSGGYGGDAYDHRQYGSNSYAPPPPAAATMGRDHWLDERDYNGTAYGGNGNPRNQGGHF